MFEKKLFDYLTEELDGIAVAMELPPNPPKSIVTLQKTGSRKENHIETATFVISCYGDTLLQSAETKERVKKAVESYIETDDVQKVTIESDYERNDTTTKKHRYMIVASFVM